MSKRELYNVEIPAFLHIVTGILLEPRLHTTAPNPDLLLECLNLCARRTRLHKRHSEGDMSAARLDVQAITWATLDQQALDFAEKLPPDIYKKARAVLRKRRLRN